jgi:hypothetical protein
LPTAASDIVLGWVCNGAVESSGAEFAPLGRYLREDAVTEQRVQRRLAAILAADVVGYSALMQSAEEATYAEFEGLKRELISTASGKSTAAPRTFELRSSIPLTGKEEKVMIIKYRHQCHVRETGQPPRKRYIDRHRSWRNYSY